MPPLPAPVPTSMAEGTVGTLLDPVGQRSIVHRGGVVSSGKLAVNMVATTLLPALWDLLYNSISGHTIVQVNGSLKKRKKKLR